MLKSIIISAVFACTGLFAQKALNINSAAIAGKVSDNSNKKALPLVNVFLYKTDTLLSKLQSDANGDFLFNNLKEGNYKIKANYTGYSAFELKNIIVKTGQKTELKIKMINVAANLQEVMIVDKECRKKDNSVNSGSMGCSKIAACQTGYNVAYAALPSYNSQDFNTEEYSKINDNEFKESLKDPLSTMSIDVDKASYSNMRRFVSKGSLPPADAVRVEEFINYFSYSYPQPKGDVPFSITTEYTQCAWNKKHHIIHIGIQGKEIQSTNMPANNLVFLIDVSGSMMSADKLPLLKSGLALLVDQLRPIDKVSLVVYAGAAGLVLEPTSGDKKKEIIDAIEKLQAGGSTAGGAGIALAYKTAKENYLKDGNNRVILCTDGDFNVGASSDGELVTMIEKKREEGTFLTVLGFGTGNYKDSKMEQLADKGDGNYAYIDNILEAKKVLVKEMGGTLLTIAKDVKIQIEFNPAKVKGYRLVGYENRLLNKEDFNNDKKDAGELGAGHTVTAIYEIIPAGSDELLASVDPLKYQANASVPKSSSGEIMTIKFRYKEPNEKTSKLITEVVNDRIAPFNSTSENCKFSSAVAEFGMLLRDSKFKAESDFKTVLALAKESKGKDEDGYRSEFIRLVEMAELLKK